LFDDPVEQARSDSMMHVTDAINRRMVLGSVTVVASGIRQRWAMRREKKSPYYTTEWGSWRMLDNPIFSILMNFISVSKAI
jgi:DNA polymerase V